MHEPSQNRILVVDDDQINRMLLGRYLEKEGHYVEFAVHGREALKKLSASHFDMVLLDIEMPEMNGYQVLEQIKLEPKWRDMPVIVTSALEELDSVVHCIEMGAEDYLTKPVNRVLLKARIDASLEKKHLRDRQTRLLNQLEREMELARRTQRSILPEKLPELQNYQFGALMIPTRAVGGDFYDFFNLGDDRWGVVVGDVSDKGLPAALFMTMTYSLMRVEALSGKPADQVVRSLNQYLCEMNTSSMFVTILYGILDCKQHRFDYVRAGHLVPLLFNDVGLPIPIVKKDGQAVGMVKNPLMDKNLIDIPRGGLLVLCSDGLTEPMNEHNEEFGEEGIKRVIKDNTQKTPQQICNALWDAVHEHIGDTEQQDDFTLVVMKSVVN